ncbi:MAG TPA: S8 family serine peptidase [Pyrinomonadaceae bacterium]|jgi:hypothetical protein
MSLKFSRPFALLALLAALLLAGLPPAPSARASSDDGQDGYVADELNVKLLPAGDIAQIQKQYGLERVRQFGARPIYLLRLTAESPAGLDSRALAARILAQNPTAVEFAEANYTAGAPEGSGFTWSVGDGWNAGFTWSVGGETQYRTQWAQDKIRLKDAHKATKGAGVIVAVLDTGVDRRHPALAGRLVGGRDFVDGDDDPSEVLPAPCAGSSDRAKCGPYGHGTHVAGLVALTAPEARIMPLRVLDPQGVGDMWVLAEAVRYALDPDGDPSTDDGADVINMSLATVHDSRLLREIIGDACDTGVPTPHDKVVVVAAAGNDYTTRPLDGMYPAAENFDGELSVAASRSDDLLWAESQRDGRVDLMAPGVGLTSSVPGNGTGTWAGTSMASPLVAGVAALVRAAAPSMTADDVKERIRETAPRPAPEQAVKRRLDAAASVAALTAPGVNPIDDTSRFVRQHYLDFFNRAPDAEGLAFWTDNVETCGADAACREVRRVNGSAAFFLSIEFRQTGYFVYRLHKAAFGDLPGAPVPVRYEDFMPDTQQIGEGVVVRQPGWEKKLDANRDAFVLDFVTRAGAAGGRDFSAQYKPGTPAADIVDALFRNVGVTPLAAERDALVRELSENPDSPALRASALRKVADSPLVVRQEFARAFVLMQYFGYLRRNPNDAPEANRDFTGYNFWLGKLNEFNGDFQAAEMVKAFLSADEYRQRFGR